MLTAELLDFSRRQGRLVPRLLNVDDSALLQQAADLLALLQAQIGRSRAEAERALEHQASQSAAAGAGPLRAKALLHLALEHCTFEMRAPVDPRLLRRALFDAAARYWLAEPLSAQAALLEAAPLEATPHEAAALSSAPVGLWSDARTEQVAQVARDLGLAPALAEEALYADVEANHVLAAVGPAAPRQLLLRYNLAQVQGLLLRSDRLEIAMPWPTPQRLRQLLGWLKFHGLLYELSGAEPDGAAPGGLNLPGRLHLTVDGPLSVLEGSATYGLALAQFFPALLLHPGPWRLLAQVRLKRGAPAELLLEPHPGLRSPYPDHGQWVPDSVRGFVQAFNARQSAWHAAPAERLVALPGNAWLVPDYDFTHIQSGAKVALQHVLHPVRERVQTLLGRIAQVGGIALLPTPAAAAPVELDGPLSAYWLACRRVPSLPDSPHLLAYRRTLLPALVLERLQALE